MSKLFTTYVVHNIVVAPSPSASVQAHFADVEAVVGGLPTLAQLALVRVGLAPPHQVGSCGQGVHDGVH